MSRWTIPSLGEMTGQQVFDACAYFMLAKGGAPRDLLIKPESRPYNRRRPWPYLVRHKRAPVTHSSLIAHLEDIHRNQPPEQWPASLDHAARTHGLQSHNME